MIYTYIPRRLRRLDREEIAALEDRRVKILQSCADRNATREDIADLVTHADDIARVIARHKQFTW